MLDSGFRVDLAFEFRVPGSWFQFISGFGFQDSGFGFRISGFVVQEYPPISRRLELHAPPRPRIRL